MTKPARALRDRVVFGLSATALAVLLPEWWCPIARWTPFSCPGCGMTRALWAMAHGEFTTAWEHHPLSFLVLPAALAGAVLWRSKGVRRGTRSADEAPPRQRSAAGAPHRPREATVVALIAACVTAAWLVWLLRPLLRR